MKKEFESSLPSNPFNKKQILLDWINTIDEPQCLLVSDIEHLEDGSVFLEILKNYLRRNNLLDSFSKEIKKAQSVNTESKFNYIFTILFELIDGKILENFLPLGDLNKENNQNMLLKFVEVFRNMYAGEVGNEIEYDIENEIENEVLSEKSNYSNFIIESSKFNPGFNPGYNNSNKKDNNKENTENYIDNNFNFRKDTQESLYELPDNTYTDNSHCSNKNYNNSANKILKRPIFNYNLKKNFETDQYNSIDMNKHNIREVNNNNKKEKENTFLANLERNAFIHIDKHKPNHLFSQNKNNEFHLVKEKLLNNNKKKDLSLSISASKTTSVSPLNEEHTSNISYRDNSNIIDTTINNVNLTNALDFNKIYSKREKAEMILFRGIPFPANGNTSSSKVNKHTMIDFNNQKVVLLKFFKPTNPILNVDFSECTKYKPNSDFLNNQSNDEKLIPVPLSPAPLTEKYTANVNTNRSRTYKVSYPNTLSPSGIDTANATLEVKNNLIDKSQRENTHRDDDNNISFLHNKNEDIVLGSTKNKIYFWLIDLNILKENSIKADDLPNLCANGVLLADLINRLEGRSESIKGIVRKTTLKSHIQVNINKVLEHLRSIGKFNTRHLWSNNEIAGAKAQVVWELLEDIWHLYSNKNNLIKKDIMKRRIKSNNNSEGGLKQDRISNRSHSNVNTNTNRSRSPLKNNTHLLYPLNPKEKNNDLSSKLNSNKTLENKNENLTTLLNNTSHIENYSYNYTNTYHENLHKVKNIAGGFEKYTDINNYRKLSNLSTIQNNKLNTPSKVKKELNRSNESITNNLNVIANCLGMDKSKAKRKRDGPSSSHVSFTSNNLINALNTHKDKPYNTRILTNIESRSRINGLPPKSKERVNTNNSNNTPNKNTSVNKDRSCFVIFKKTNAKKLKKEIDRYTNNSYHTDNSIIKDDNKINNDDKELISNRGNYKFIKQSENENKNISINQLQIISTEESCKSKQNNICDADKQENNIKEWLVTMGVKGVVDIEFTKEEVNDFRDGILLSKIVAVLENKKIGGINPNPRSCSASLKNITKSLEVLRIKQNMPFEYLWCEEEIYRGNGAVIRGLLSDIKKTYTKETDFLNTHNNTRSNNNF